MHRLHAEPRSISPGLLDSSSRIPGLDVTRVIACVGVIWYHSGHPHYHELGFFRMPFYSALLAYLVAATILSGKRRTFGEFIHSRAVRLLVPFVLWMIPYKLPGLIVGHVTLPPTLVELLMGWDTVLWFLPFAFCASVLAFLVARTMEAFSRRGQISAMLVLLAVGTALTFRRMDAIDIIHVRQAWVPLMGSVLLGVAAAALVRLRPGTLRVHHLWIVWIVLAVIFDGLSMLPYPAYSTWLGSYSAAFLLLAGLSMPAVRWPALWKYLGQLSYGMYLTHFFFIMALNHAPVREGVGVLRFLISLGGAVAVSALLQKSRVGRVFLGMEGQAKKRPVRPIPMAIPSQTPAQRAISVSV